ncbi:hypothetical protein AB0K21_42275 [Streptosporangium sp. NPDC049248]|uniref:hypothetical protein n=1 Tax=Streptosporangium sp. NPDC049248 TaxID=3155651 RepID=UPI00343B5EAF
MSDTHTFPHPHQQAPTPEQVPAPGNGHGGAAATSMPIGRHAPHPAPAAAPVPASGGQHPYPAAPTAGQEQAAPSLSAPQQRPELPPPPLGPPEPPRREPGMWVQWWQACRTDSAVRKARGQGRWWLMRWMNEQPTSVADLLDFYLHQRDERADGRRGWGLRTGVPIVNGVHAAFYRAYGLTLALALTLATYALGWMGQRPGRALLLAIAAVVVHINLSTWLGAGS